MVVGGGTQTPPPKLVPTLEEQKEQRVAARDAAVAAKREAVPSRPEDDTRDIARVGLERYCFCTETNKVN